MSGCRCGKLTIESAVSVRYLTYLAIKDWGSPAVVPVYGISLFRITSYVGVGSVSLLLNCFAVISKVNDIILH